MVGILISGAITLYFVLGYWVMLRHMNYILASPGGWRATIRATLIWFLWPVWYGLRFLQWVDGKIIPDSDKFHYPRGHEGTDSPGVPGLAGNSQPSKTGGGQTPYGSPAHPTGRSGDC